MSPIPVRFRPRAVPLAPRAVTAHGEAARALGRRLLALPDAALARLEGVAGDGLLVVAGAEAELPWVDGALYLGLDPAEPALLLPTALEPDVPAPLLARAVGKRLPKAAPPLALLVAPVGVVSLAKARAISRAALEAWRSR